MAKAHLLYGGTRESYESGIAIRPIEEALRQLSALLE
jgi:hypothetical protein